MNTMSGVLGSRLEGLPEPSPPRPGFVLLENEGSAVPSGEVSGRPMLRPCPGMVRQLVPSTKPMDAQLWLASVSTVPAVGPAPGKPRVLAALLPEGANLSNCAVSNQFP